MTGQPLHAHTAAGIAASIRELLADPAPGNRLEERGERRE